MLTGVTVIGENKPTRCFGNYKQNKHPKTNIKQPKTKKTHNVTKKKQLQTKNASNPFRCVFYCVMLSFVSWLYNQLLSVWVAMVSSWDCDFSRLSFLIVRVNTTANSIAVQITAIVSAIGSAMNTAVA